MAATPRGYFSFRSPYSWLAYRDLTAHHRDLAESITWRPFWEPDETSRRMLDEAGGSFPYVPMSAAKHRYLLQDVRRLARRRQLRVTWPVDRAPCWEVAHLGYLAAQAEGRGPDFLAGAYRARWEQGRDLSDRSVIAGIAAELGLPTDRVANATDDPELRRLGLAALLAIDHDGVFGVPFFIQGADKYWGLDRLPAFVEAVREAGSGTAEAGHRPDPAEDRDDRLADRDDRPADRENPADHDEPAEDRDGPADGEPGADPGHAGGCG